MTKAKRGKINKFGKTEYCVQFAPLQLELNDAVRSLRDTGKRLKRANRF